MFEKLDMKTINFTDENIKKIAEIFPNVVSEDENGKVIDFEALKQELSGNIAEGYKERYSLNWPGKREAQLKANAPTTKTLRPCIEESVNFDTTENLYIEGDNLEVLKILQEGYLNKIKMIYIDPPYNTGKDFVYKDNFTRDSKEELLESGQIDEDGGKLVANTETNGRYHSDWLSMMYPRLKLARNLLKEDGVIFISIDDNEVHNLRKMCDEIFGEANFISLLSIENNPKGRKNSKFISVSNEFCLIYSKNNEKSYFIENIPKNIKDMTLDENGSYVHNSGKRVLVGENKFNNVVSNFKSEKHFSVYYNKTTHDLILKQETDILQIDNQLLDKGYVRYISYYNDKFVENTYTKSKFKELFFNRALDFKDNKIFEKNFNSLIRMKSLITNREYNALVNGEAKNYKIDVKTTSAGTYLKELFNSKEVLFSAPKSIGLINLFINLFEDKEQIILDFFSGSATTAEAVIKVNSEDGGNRKFIMVQLPEIIDSKNNKVAYEFVKNELKKDSVVISEIGKERIRRAGKNIVEETGKTDLDIGFRVLKLDSSNMKDIYFTPQELGQSQMDYSVDNIKEDRSDLDLLFGVLIDWGVDLTLPIKKEVIQGKDCYFVDSDSLCAYFGNDINEEFIKELAKKEALRFVFKDSSFGNNDDLKDNVSQIFKQLNPSAEIKVI